MNRVELIGNLTRDPELSETSSGTTYCRLSIAVSRPYTDGDGNREADFFNITVWRTQAENCGRYLKKGNKIGVSGSLQNRSFTATDGTKRTVTEICATNIDFLTPVGNSENTANSTPQTAKKAENTVNSVLLTAKKAEPVQQSIGGLQPIADDDLPF